MPEPLFETVEESAGAHILAGADLARELTGTLPCARCRYNLKGLSVRNECPECGLPVRATLLAVIDPHATEIQPMSRPRLTGILLLVWAFAMVGVAIAAWLLRFGDAFALLGVRGMTLAWADGVLRHAIVVLTLAAGVGAATFVRPHRGIAVGRSVLAALAAFAFVPLAMIEWRIGVIDGTSVFHYFGGGAAALPSPERSEYRIAWGMLVAASALMLRPNARLFVARSMLLRSGKVDRQTLMGIAGAAAVGVLGDIAHLMAPQAGPDLLELVRYIGTVLIALSSMLLAAGVFLVMVDTVRIFPTVVALPLTLEDVLEPAPGRESAT